MTSKQTLCTECRKADAFAGGGPLKCACGEPLTWGERHCCVACAKKDGVCTNCGEALPKKLPEECDCDCHDNPNIRHVMACCSSCQHCGRPVKSFELKGHEQKCSGE